MPAPLQSLELLLDDEADALARGLWDRLAEAGIPSQAQHRAASNAPHVTLVAARSIALPAAAPPLPVPLVLGSPVVLGSGPSRALALLVVPTTRLLAVHDGLWATTTPEGATPFSAPGRWTPHVTLARRVPLDLLGPALATLDGAEVTASAIGLRHWDPVTRTVTPL